MEMMIEPASACRYVGTCLCVVLISVPPVAASETAFGLPSARAGPDRVVVAGTPVTVHGYGASPDSEIVEYSWDLDADGTADLISARDGTVTHVFAYPGEYPCTLTVRDSFGRSATDTARITVVSSLEDMPEEEGAPPFYDNPPDGEFHRYAVMLNGGSETRYWVDVELGWDMFTNGYGLPPEDIYLLNYRGTDPYGGNPGGMIDDEATLATVEAVFDELALRADGDDEIFVWITDHGRGYTGPLSQGGRYLGYLDGRASVDPGDEEDFPETDFPLRGIFTPGDYGCNHGMGVWKVRRMYYGGRTDFSRNKFSSTLKNVYIESLGQRVRDNDLFIERLVDYALGDFNRDGFIDTAEGEVFDYDGDGQQPYDHGTGVFDEDDWGEIDVLDDDYNKTNGGLPEGAHPIKLFDPGLEGRVCIDLGYTGGDPVADGCDDENDGLFNWMDANQDGDLLDMVSVDEGLVVHADEIWDDFLAEQYDRLSADRIVTMALPCFSGGLVEDLSAPGRVIATATIEEAISWGDGFIRNFTAAMHGRDQHGNPVDADTDASGYVDMVEAFNYAAVNDHADEIPQYDDNGDGISHTDPIPAGGDGVLGAGTYFCNSTPTGAGRVTGALVVDRGAGGDLELDWGPSCLDSDQDYEIYEGLLGDFGSHQPLSCTTGWATYSVVTPGGGSTYYLVVPRNDSLREGSYGLDGHDMERPPSGSACLEQIAADCP
jgi:PKD repeat protein